MQLRRINKKINKHLEDIEKEDEVISKFLIELIKKENGRGENWHYKKEYRRFIKLATEEWVNNAKN